LLSLKRDVRAYCYECIECQRAKSSRHKSFGLLRPIEPPARPWVTVTMDFIIDLPESKAFNGLPFVRILVVVDKHIKMARYAPVRAKMSVAELVEVFLREVVRHHGVPKAMISDQDTLFKSEEWNFWSYNMNETLQTSGVPSAEQRPNRDTKPVLSRRSSEYSRMSTKVTGRCFYHAQSSRTTIAPIQPSKKPHSKQSRGGHPLGGWRIQCAERMSSSVDNEPSNTQSAQHSVRRRSLKTLPQAKRGQC